MKEQLKRNMTLNEKKVSFQSGEGTPKSGTTSKKGGSDDNWRSDLADFSLDEIDPQ